MSILINPKSVNPRRTKNQSGFTIIEILVVVLMVGIVGAIAAPTWLMFANRQKVRTVNDRVFNAIQEAQSRAQLTSLSHFIQFGEHRGIPAYRIYLTTTKDDKLPDWQTLDVNGEINEGQITLRAIPANENTIKRDNALEFDHLGVLVRENNITEDNPFWVVVSSADNSVTHCVAVRTRLLSTQKLQGDDCNP
ncbi:MAG: type II secretion system protein [Limnospira sp. PMC 1286.21]|uniref:type II secretion system protein n=1 Tax=unclassified Limnospira TaxID=2642885 RepID=UPI0028E1820D|nr:MULTISPECIES: type II secretion system protein [unclassified Limnospira]MDT9299191.1 type II secretion system protein [Limnospira sp. PMC 1281.21]MDT9319347.1 type II secretion system protein [Limnospira sp. PMC 1290.21]MDT9324670.1 type II secretion system protein [Limnospira sp. PMC 1286.21]